jgi:hypothetical protein
LVAGNAPMIVSFLYKTFIQPNVRTMAQPKLASRLANYLYGLREKLGEESFRNGNYMTICASIAWVSASAWNGSGLPMAGSARL